MGIAHFDDAPARAYDLGHLRGCWTMLGDAAGSETVGVRRIQLPAGGWSTPVHDHGRAEEIFYVLAGTGVSWHNGHTAAIGAGDCILYLPRRGGHTLHSDEGLDVLAFGTREFDEALALPRLGLSMAGRRGVESIPPPGDGTPLQHVREAELGPPEMPATPGERPGTIVNVADVPAERVERPRVARVRRNLGRAVGSRRAGLQHVTVDPGRYATPEHCHSLEEEIFVILSGTGVAHAFRAETELELLAYGTRERNDICFYPRSNKIAFWGVDVIARVERISDYWDGED